MTRNWTGPAMLAAVIVLALTPVLFAADAAPAAGAGATTQPIEVKQSTPKDLVETDILASERMDFDVLLRIIAPDYKDAAKLMVNTLTKTTQLGDRLAKLGDAMEELQEDGEQGKRRGLPGRQDRLGQDHPRGKGRQGDRQLDRPGAPRQHGQD
jgi:hypothetical protein